MGKKSRSGSGMNIPHHISERLETIFQVKILNFFDGDPDPGFGNLFDPGSGDLGSGMEKIRIRDPLSVINIPDPHHCFRAINFRR
jgi:hypothetical protein